jgi:acyl-CoA thioester hydrolase
MVRMEVNYMRELHWPGNIEVGTGVAEFGRSSFKVEQAIFRDGGCAATGRATLVCIDLASRKARPLPDEAVARLSQWKYRGSGISNQGSGISRQ